MKEMNQWTCLFLWVIGCTAAFFIGYAVAERKMNVDPNVQAAQINLWDAQARLAEAQAVQVKDMMIRTYPGPTVYTPIEREPEEIEPVPMDEEELPEPTLAKPQEEDE